MWKARLKVNMKCPVHPRYNPEKGGRGAIKGGCRMCESIAIAHEKLYAGSSVSVWVRIAQEEIEDYENKRKLRL